MSTELNDLLKYLDNTSSDLRLREKQRAQGVGLPSNFWKPKDGDNKIRVLPALPGDLTYVKVVQHWITDTGTGRGGSTLCLAGMGQGHCPVCAYVHELEHSGHPEDTDKARQVKAKMRYVYNFVDLSGDIPRVVPAWVPDSVHEAIDAQRDQCLEDGVPDQVCHPLEGRVITVNVSQNKGGWREYKVRFGNKALPLEAEWVRQAKPVSSYITIPDTQLLNNYVASMSGHRVEPVRPMRVSPHSQPVVARIVDTTAKKRPSAWDTEDESA